MVADEEVDSPSEVVERLDRIAALLALSVVRRMKEPDQIRVLDAVGYTAAEIGRFIGKKPNTVSAALYRQRTAPSPRKRRSRQARK